MSAKSMSRTDPPIHGLAVARPSGGGAENVRLDRDYRLKGLLGVVLIAVGIAALLAGFASIVFE